MISKAKFMHMVRLYREAGQTDVTAYAANFSYTELTQGRKTALVHRIERMYRRQMNEYDIGSFVVASQSEKTGPARSGAIGHNYLDPKYLEKVLDPKFNLDNRKATYRRAHMDGKQYIIWDCPEHGNSMYRISVSQLCTKADVGRYEGYCLLCKTATQARYEEKIRAIKKFYENYMKLREYLGYKEHLGQSAS